jgi:hypothetical protein
VLAVSELSSERSLKPLVIKDPIKTLWGSLISLKPFKDSVSPNSTPPSPPSTAPPALGKQKESAQAYNGVQGSF